jgi:hypothetical protein
MHQRLYTGKIFLSNSAKCRVFYMKMARVLKGQSHEKVGEMSVWGISLGPN